MLFDTNPLLRVRGLSLPPLEELSEALLDFERMTDLIVWLDEHQLEENCDRYRCRYSTEGH
ncbi:MAG: DUF4351 domain-containing protein [Microcoleus sp. SIO2G3]|nr:DUF4351 domain-containing protein [Microcoleus sp. SIO2G3]